MAFRTKPGAPPPQTIDDYYALVSDPSVYGDSGICAHLPYLEALSGRSQSAWGNRSDDEDDRPNDRVRIVELGTGGGDQSTVAFLAGSPLSLTTYDINVPSTFHELSLMAKEVGCDFKMYNGSTSMSPVVPCDILFVDTLHDADTVVVELERFAPHCTSRIVFHDVVAFGREGQFRKGQDQGINHAIFEWMCRHPEWTIERFVDFDNGLLTLKRS